MQKQWYNSHSIDRFFNLPQHIIDDITCEAVSQKSDVIETVRYTVDRPHGMTITRKKRLRKIPYILNAVA